MRTGRRRSTGIALLAALGLWGCRGAFYTLGVAFLYEEVELPDAQVLRDLPYRSEPGADAQKHRLDLFLPERGAGGAWPVVVFVHGGGWRTGDKALVVGGADVYGNIGRFFASHGIGAAVVNYRLQPRVTWTEQVEDVRRATRWVREHIADRGGDPGAIFLMGHSAGAHLAAHVALDAEQGVCGWIPVSGAGFDLSDPETYALGADPGYYERRFRNGDDGEGWKRDASPVGRIGAGAAPALVLYAEDDWPSLHRQAEVVDGALRAAGVRSRLVRIPDEDHYSVVLALTREDKAAAPAVLDFVRGTACPPGGGASAGRTAGR